MIRANFETIYDVIDFASEQYEEIVDRDNLGMLQIVCKDYEQAKTVVTELVRMGYDIFSMELTEPEWDGYDREFYVAIFKEGVCVEKAYHDDKYYGSAGDFCIVFEGCSDEILCRADFPITIEAHVEDEECDEDCECCEHRTHTTSKEEAIKRFLDYLDKFTD